MVESRSDLATRGQVVRGEYFSSEAEPTFPNFTLTLSLTVITQVGGTLRSLAERLALSYSYP